MLYFNSLTTSSTIGIYCIAHTMFRGSKKKYQLSWSDSQWQNVIKHHCMNHHIGSWWLSYVCLSCRYTATILIFHQQYLSNICKRLFPMGGRRSQYSFEYIYLKIVEGWRSLTLTLVSKTKAQQMLDWYDVVIQVM